MKFLQDTAAAATSYTTHSGYFDLVGNGGHQYTYDGQDDIELQNSAETDNGMMIKGNDNYLSLKILEKTIRTGM